MGVERTIDVDGSDLRVARAGLGFVREAEPPPGLPDVGEVADGDERRFDDWLLSLGNGAAGGKDLAGGYSSVRMGATRSARDRRWSSSLRYLLESPLSPVYAGSLIIFFSLFLLDARGAILAGSDK
jgi:hypothetical protein